MNKKTKTEKRGFKKRPYEIPYDTKISGIYEISSKNINTTIRIVGAEPNDDVSHSLIQSKEGKNELIGSVNVKNTSIQKMAKGHPVMAKIVKDYQVKITRTGNLR
jgi:hypothetical protein